MQNGNITNTAQYNIALGKDIYRLSNSSGSTFSGDSNIGIGNQVYTIISGNLTGTKNIGLGQGAFTVFGGDLSGHHNIALGSATMNTNTSGGDLSGNYNTAVGYNSMYTKSGITGGYNLALGHQAMRIYQGKIAGDNNIAIGSVVLNHYTNGDLGSHNIGIGYGALTDMGRGNGNVQLGNSTIGSIKSGELNNVVAIGNWMNNLTTSNTDSNTILLGNQSSNPNSPKVGVGTYKPQAKLDVAGAVRVADDSSACTTTNRGTIRFSTNHFYGCDGTTWKQLDN